VGILENGTGENAVRNTVLALAIASALAVAAPALAQVGGAPNTLADSVHLKTDVEVKQEREREAGYKSGLGKIPDAKGKKDPWGNVRSDSASAQNQHQPKSNTK
jgi:hypothetical protein